MRQAVMVVLLFALAGCQSWDWRRNGQAFLQSLCYGVEPCDVTGPDANPADLTR